MGVCIQICDVYGTDDPEWDWFRQDRDREFSHAVTSLPVTQRLVPEDWPDTLYRPSDFDVWEAYLTEHGYGPRYFLFLSILRKDEGLWFHID